jgi:hypothetical protein
VQYDLGVEASHDFGLAPGGAAVDCLYRTAQAHTQFGHLGAQFGHPVCKGDQPGLPKGKLLLQLLTPGSGEVALALVVG